jgi:hypothetical protein
MSEAEESPCKIRMGKSITVCMDVQDKWRREGWGSGRGETESASEVEEAYVEAALLAKGARESDDGTQR